MTLSSMYKAPEKFYIEVMVVVSNPQKNPFEGVQLKFLFDSPLTVDKFISFSARLAIASFSEFCLSGEWRILSGISYIDFN